MRKHPLRKFSCLTLLYAALIIGIFVLQFKTESVITVTAGALRATLAQDQAEDADVRLKNQFQVEFRGLTFTTNESVPAILSNSQDEEQTQAAVLSAYAVEPLAMTFTFGEDAALRFELSGEGEDAQLFITAFLSNGFDTMTLPYGVSSAYAVAENDGSRAILTAKGGSIALSAAAISPDRLTLSGPAAGAALMDYEEPPPTAEEFTSVAGLPLTDAATYTASIKQLRETLVTRFTSALLSQAADTLTEAEVVAYVAEMGRNNRYNTALDAVPSSFKLSSRRTYISAPFFDNLVAMNRSLTQQTERYRTQVEGAVANQNLDIFTVGGISDYILREKRKPAIASLLAFPGMMEPFAPTVTQAAGIINVYTKLHASDRTLAALLAPLLDACTATITANASLSNDVLLITDNSIPLPAEQTVLLGAALVALASITAQQKYADMGRLLVNQQLANLSGMSLQTMAALYPILVTDNSYYPHTLILGYYGNNAVWAWTCAEGIAYTPTREGTVNVEVNFPLNDTHYLIFSGVPTFHSRIEIQNLMFRTAPDFESYNSSGYVYQEDSQSLLIKSRHKSRTELIRLFCDPATNYVSAQ